MTRLALITPTHRPDLELFRTLHGSVLEHTPDNVVHHALVPAPDVALFSSMRSSRLVVTAVDDILPRRFITTFRTSRALRRAPGLRRFPAVQAVNVRRPWPPVRGWVLQQVAKLAAAARLDADVVLAVDSDVCFIRPVSGDTFRRDATTRLYRRPDAIDDTMTGHLAWHATAQRLLGLPEGSTGRTDYIAPMVPLDPPIVRAMCQRVESISGRPWLDAVAGQVSVSEYILYGVYADHLAPPRARSFTSTRSLCLSRWGSAPFGREDTEPFLANLANDDVAVHLQSTSHTDPGIRGEVVATARGRERVRDPGGR